jgi:sugar fermentation stimulation protein A
MKLPKMIPAQFVQRDNRFLATVIVNGDRTWAHVPNSGRLQELFKPGRTVWIAPAASEKRKTSFDLKLVEYHDVLVSVDARLPNPLFAEAVRNNRLTGFEFPIIQPEVTQLDSRLDFKLSGPDGICWVETKSVTLVEQDLALFPDAPTHRGRRHLEDLIKLRKKAARTAVVFIIQRPDATAFAPNESADPVFAETLRNAAIAGVEVRAFRCEVSLDEIFIVDEVPVILESKKIS